MNRSPNISLAVGLGPAYVEIDLEQADIRMVTTYIGQDVYLGSLPDRPDWLTAEAVTGFGLDAVHLDLRMDFVSEGVEHILFISYYGEQAVLLDANGGVCSELFPAFELAPLMRFVGWFMATADQSFVEFGHVYRPAINHAAILTALNEADLMLVE
jgi:hypothetical protein